MTNTQSHLCCTRRDSQEESIPIEDVMPKERSRSFFKKTRKRERRFFLKKKEKKEEDGLTLESTYSLTSVFNPVSASFLQEENSQIVCPFCKKKRISLSPSESCLFGKR